MRGYTRARIPFLILATMLVQDKAPRVQWEKGRYFQMYPELALRLRVIASDGVDYKNHSVPIVLPSSIQSLHTVVWFPITFTRPFQLRPLSASYNVRVTVSDRIQLQQQLRLFPPSSIRQNQTQLHNNTTYTITTTTANRNFPPPWTSLYTAWRPGWSENNWQPGWRRPPASRHLRPVNSRWSRHVACTPPPPTRLTRSANRRRTCSRTLDKATPQRPLTNSCGRLWYFKCATWTHWSSIKDRLASEQVNGFR